MTDSFQLGIRAVAARKLNCDGWADVCALLDGLSDDTVRSHIDELELELNAWSPQLRSAPARWVARLQSQGHEPRVRLCRLLDVSRTPNRDEMYRTLDADDAMYISALVAERCGLDEAAMPGFASRLARIGVEQLWLRGNDIGSGILHVLRLSSRGVLRSLDAKSCGLGQGVLGAVAADGVVIRLHELGLADNHLGSQDVEFLARIPGLDEVQRLALGGNKFLACQRSPEAAEFWTGRSLRSG